LLVEVLGSSDWATIAERMPGKNQRQCRERWTNYLAPTLNTAHWTREEDILLIQKYSEFGAKWVQVAAFFPNRTDSMMKNRFNKLQRREQKRRELFLRGELGFALPALQSAVAARPAAPPPEPEPEPRPAVAEAEPEFAVVDLWGESFGLEDGLLSF
jgi:hypothetical protein